MPVAIARADPVREGWPHSVPQIASASADNKALITDANSCRMRSGEASDKAPPSRRARSIMPGAVVVTVSFRERCERFTRKITP